MKSSPSNGAKEFAGRRLLLLLTIVAGFIAVADGLAMILPGETNTLGGLVLLMGGSLWFALGVPRFVRPEARPFYIAMLAILGSLLLPLLFLPVCGL